MIPELPKRKLFRLRVMAVFINEDETKEEVCLFDAEEGWCTETPVISWKRPLEPVYKGSQVVGLLQTGPIVFSLTAKNGKDEGQILPP